MKRLAVLLALFVLVGGTGLPVAGAFAKIAKRRSLRPARRAHIAATSQNGTSVNRAAGLQQAKVVCEYIGADRRPQKSFSFATLAEAVAAVDRILKATGIDRSVIDIQASSDVKTVAKSGVDGYHHLYIYYNAADINSLVLEAGTPWAADFILLHEIGHLHYGHPFENDGANPQEEKQIHYRQELEADKYAGFMLRRMKVSLADAQAAVRVYQDELESSTHPPKAARLNAISEGWEESDRQIRDLVAASGVPTPAPSTPPAQPRAIPRAGPPRAPARSVTGEAQISVRNTSRMMGTGWWAWTAYIEAPPEVLDQVNCVEYQLHPTFRPPSVRVCQMGDGEPFALKAKGWGSFLINVRVFMKDGRTYDLQHYLALQ
jgi:hypothetical protein